MNKTIALLLSTLALCASSAFSQEDKHELSVILENDKFLAIDATDRHYTHGTLLTYWDKEGEVPLLGRVWQPALLDWMPSLGLNAKVNRYGFLFSQKMYTPVSLTNTALIPNDRPYAGWFYGGALMQRRGDFKGIPTRDIFEIDLGIVGRSAHGGNTQNFVHRVIHVGEAQGWNNQLRDEVGLNFHAERNFLIAGRDNNSLLGWDMIPMMGFDLGNVRIAGTVGATLRGGFNLPNDFSAFETKKWGLYGFATMEGHAVGRNIFLDGNSFRKSHSVDKLPLVADLKVGLVWKACSNFEVSYQYVYRTREFEQQTDEDRYGVITARVMF